MSTKGKVLMAMSGGIDSTVAALMLHKEGYEVVGITMKTWDYAASVGTTGKKETGCCNLYFFYRMQILPQRPWLLRRIAFS